MADPYAVAVTMDTLVKGVQEEFSNVFHYDAEAIVNSTGGFEALADQVVSALRPLFTTRVNFKRVRVHGPTDLTKVEDQMKLVKDLTGTGSLVENFSMPPELAIVADVYVGRGPKGGKQMLRKFLHSCGLPGSGGSSDQAFGRAALAAGVKTPIESALNSLKTVTVAGFTNDICTPAGKHLPVGSTWAVNPYVATRQFRKGRKERNGG
jgi:hypothetical protein